MGINAKEYVGEPSTYPVEGEPIHGGWSEIKMPGSFVPIGKVPAGPLTMNVRISGLESEVASLREQVSALLEVLEALEYERQRN